MAEEQTVFSNEARRYLGVVHKRRTLVLTCLVVSLLAATLYNYTTRPVYQATAQILIDRRAQSVLPTTGDRLDTAELTDMATQLELLRGREVAEKVVEKLQLHKTDEFQMGPMMSPRERFERKFLGRKPELLVDNAGIPMSPAAAAFRSRLTLEPLAGSRLVNLRFRAYDPRIAQQAINTLAQLYIEQTMDFRNTTSNAASGWLGDRLKEQQEKVRSAEKALQQYKERENIAVGEDREDLINQKISTLSGAIIQARMDRLQKEAALTQVRSTSPSQWDAIPVVLANPSVQSHRAQLADLQRERARLGDSLGEKHPDMIKLRGDIKALEEKILVEVQGVIQSLEGGVLATRQQEATLQENLEAAKKEGLELGKKSGEYSLLKREVDSNQALLQDLMNRASTTGLETELRATNVRIVELAEYPRAPFTPQRMRNYQMALLIGLALGIGLAVFFEHIDNTVKTPDDIKGQMGLPFLGMVPQVAVRPGAGSVQKLMNENPQAPVAEAYRLLRTNLLFCSPDASGLVIVISSPSPGEGKTTTVANLAASLAQNGARVLAIDGDLRRPTLHQHFAIHKAPGLSDLIVGKCQASEAVQITRFKGLHVLPCGYIPPNPAELLGSQNMKSALAAFKKHYDWVILDTAPILAMADTPVVCPYTDGLVMVVAAEQTPRPAIQRAVDQVHGVGGKLLGVVLNKVNLERNSYYYSQYYGGYYRSYYSETPRREKPVAVKRA